MPPKQPLKLNDEQLAAELDVSRRTVGNYAEAGMPHTVEKGYRRFDLAACRAWVEANKPTPTTGGKRPHEIHAAQNGHAAERPNHRGRRSKEDVDRDGQTVRRLVDNSDPEEIAAVVRAVADGAPGALTASAVKTLRDGLQAEREAIKLAQERRDVVPVKDVRAKLLAALLVLGEKLDTLPARLAHAAVGALGVTPDREAHVREAIEREMGELLGELERLEV